MPPPRDEYYPIFCHQIWGRIGPNIKYFSNSDCHSRCSPKFFLPIYNQILSPNFVLVASFCPNYISSFCLECKKHWRADEQSQFYRSKKLTHFKCKHINEASYFDRFNMTKNGLEYDRKKFTLMNVNAIINLLRVLT